MRGPMQRYSNFVDSMLGRGEYAITVPAMDGPLLPNNALDEADLFFKTETPDHLTACDNTLFFSSDRKLMSWAGSNASPKEIAVFDHPVSAMTALPDGGLAIALDDGRLVLKGGKFEGRVIESLAGYRVVCPTALLAVGETIVVAEGSANHKPSKWCYDLMGRGSSGSIWRLDLEKNESVCLARNLAYPNGLCLSNEGDVIFSESWRHRVVRLLPNGAQENVYAHLPGYPSCISPSASGGYWLTVFAPRSALIEFVLQEHAYRRRMVAEIDQEYWIAPSLSSGKSFKEPLQNGAIKSMGILKPWAPTRSFGLLIELDQTGLPIDSFHSRSNGKRHGITSAVEYEGKVYAASKGNNEIISFDTRDR